MFSESFKENKDPEQNHRPKQEGEFFGMTPAEKELLTKAKDKYKTPEDLLRGVGWVKKTGEKVEFELKYHKLPPHKLPSKSKK
ncbi:MAG: hypothetical protein A3J46_03795 [Candidatus Yanofskybacteria bacterium RIFCSPHIGHO2_02_FULL_41_11]|uniref:Uncharacterized protein n=2 Tax=Candidatus Yanofskyibacteriota TaxID=1752733 RepID=A0A1F8F7E8_9BACT|nr:MAG: hypothetical protein A2817_00995 [Candidatus Yanofskybacteria bacterium RIFCSPHIGHO2_01_FULL_39_8b]OGN08548.1 MAG: hypothetical protein A3J46_03795 [Candidatus Yanofskybacteria bacterium RIFCSPHIGHO2_02_FULL_41_11]